MRRRSYKPIAAGPGGANCQINLEEIYNLENHMDALGQKKLHEQYPQLAQKKIEIDPNEDPRGNFVLKNKVDILNELLVVR